MVISPIIYDLCLSVLVAELVRLWKEDSNMQICVEVIYQIPEKATLLRIALLRKSTAAGRGTPEEVEEGWAATRV